MITEKDLQEAIAECEGVRNPNANTCIKLAAFYTIKEHLFGARPEPTQYSFSSGPEKTIEYDGDSEFLKIARGKNESEVLEIIDELMDTLRIINPRLYDGVIRKMTE